MDFNDPLHREVFFAVHAELPRQGPGRSAETRRALESVQLPSAARVLDVGCGPGAQTIDLAQANVDAHIEAVDINSDLLVQAQNRAADVGLSEQIVFSRQDMSQLSFDPASFDLIWSEGAAYIMGVDAALTSWQTLLKADGYIGFTDCVWLIPDPPAEIVTWWSGKYPAMLDAKAGRVRLEQAGFTCIDHFILPPIAWWSTYYNPMQANIDRLRVAYGDDRERLAVLAACEEEIDMYRRFAHCYSYAFYVGHRA